MRFITLFGLTLIAKCIDQEKVSEGGWLILIIMVMGLIVDYIEYINQRD